MKILRWSGWLLCSAALSTLPGITARGADTTTSTVRVVIPAGTSLFCPPGGGRLDGELGRQLAGLVDTIRLREPGSTNVIHLQPGPQLAWVNEAGAPYTRALEPGQGVVLTRKSAEPAHLEMPVGPGAVTVTIQEGLNIIGLPGPQPVPLAAAFEHPALGEPVGSYDETKADEIDLLNADGSWRRLIRLPTRVWYDTKTETNTTHILTPGQAFYYQRQPGAGPLQIQP